tara:strand:- start:388 stop:810 length:423 start_codon:yes stop_codon:yes gene_type:complete
MDKYVEDFKSALKKENMKFTNQRYAIFKLLNNNSGHYDCDRIISYLKKNKKFNVSRATVYRTLDLLVKYNFADKMILDDGVARYESKVDRRHHDHMICIETGKILEFRSDKIESIQEKIAKDMGYEIVKHVHQLFVKKIK